MINIKHENLILRIQLNKTRPSAWVPFCRIRRKKYKENIKITNTCEINCIRMMKLKIQIRTKEGHQPLNLNQNIQKYWHLVSLIFVSHKF